AEFKPGFRGQQSPETAPNNRVIIDDQDFHGSTPCDERSGASCRAEHGSTAAAAKPLPSSLENVRRPPIARLHTPVPTAPWPSLLGSVIPRPASVVFTRTSSL